MFGGEATVKEITEQIKASSVYQRDSKLKSLMGLETHLMQQWVRASCQNDGMGNKRYKQFFTSIVKPTLNISVSSIPQNLEDVVGRLTAIIKGQEASEEDQVRLKVACSAIHGHLESNPLITGLALACTRMSEKQSRNIFTLAGRKDNTCTERERSLLADAGMQLAMASCNAGLARECGLSSTALKLSLDELHLNSLPTPALAVRWPEILQENFQLLDQRFLRPEEAPMRHLQ